MNSTILNNQTTSKRALTFNKSFLISLVIHVFLVFGITFTTFYEISFLKDSPIINVKFANSSQDLVGLDSKKSNSTFLILLNNDLILRRIFMIKKIIKFDTFLDIYTLFFYILIIFLYSKSIL